MTLRELSTLALVAAMAATTLAQSPQPYSPPRLLRGDAPAAVPPNVVAGGVVLIEATVDRGGALTRPVVLRSTPPYSNMVLDAMRRWTFRPAEAVTSGTLRGPVEGTVLVAALYRPPTLTNEPTVGEPPRDLAAPSAEAPFPVAIVTPMYPARAASGLSPSVVMYEVSLDERGKITDVRSVVSDPGFDSVARDALLQWTFRSATYRARPAPAVAYVVFGFAVPVLGPPFLTPGQQPVPSPR